MEQRTSVMISAIVFAAVVAGAIAYLVYTRPADGPAAPQLAVSPTPGPIGEIAIATITPEPTPGVAAMEIVTPEPTPRVASAVAPSAPTGPAELALVMMAGSVIVGAFGIRRLAA